MYPDPSLQDYEAYLITVQYPLEYSDWLRDRLYNAVNKDTACV